MFIKGFLRAVNVNESDKVAARLVRIYAYHSLQLVSKILEIAINDEVKRQISSSTLFRNNSLTTHLMTAFSRFIGNEYVKNILLPTIYYIVDNIKNGVDFEVDPEKLGPKAKVKKI